MAKKDSARRQQHFKIQELEARLEEAEDALRAIRTGEVDAVVVSGAQGDQVYTLEGADKPYRVLVETMNEGTVTLLADGTIAYSNSRFADMVRVPLEEVIGSDFARFLPARQEPLFKALMEQSGSEGGKAEFTLQASDARPVPAQLSLRPLGEALAAGCCLVVTDLTELKRAEAALSAERHRLFAVLETLPVLVCLLTPDYHVAFANRAFREKFGESQGRHCYEYCFGRDAPCEFCESYQVLKTGQPHHWEVTGLDGSVIEAHDFPFTDVDGTPMILETDIDVTEVRKASAALRASEELLRSVIDCSADYIYVKDRELRTVLCNQAFAKAIGKPVGEACGKTDIQNGWDPELVKGNPEKGIQGWEVDDRRALQGEVVHAVGEPGNVTAEIRLFDTVKSPLRNAAGEITGLVGVSRDVTDRKMAEEGLRRATAALRKSHDELEQRVRERTAELHDANAQLEAELAERRRAEVNLREATRRFQTIVDHAPIAIYVKSCDGRYVFGNRRLEHYTGHPLERLLGMTDYDFAPKEDADRWRENDLKVQEGQRTEFEETGTDRDGQPYVNLSVKFALSNESGTPVEVCGISTDITERKRTEAALRESEARFRLLADGVPDLVWTCTPDGECDYLNSRYLEYTGLPPEELLGLEWLKQVHPHDRERALAEWKQTLEQDVPYETELRLRSKDGEYRYFKVRAATARDANGRVLKWFGTNTDIEDLRQSQERLAAANQELESFAHSVAHDLRAPLRGIDGFSLALAEDYRQNLDERAHTYIQRIRAAVTRMGQLIDDLLTLSHLVRVQMRRERVDLSIVALAITSNLRNSEPEREAEFAIVPGLEVEGDARLLQVLLEKLLDNAWKFSAGRHPARIEFGAKEQNGAKAYFVRDNGVGFDMAYANKLFGPFQRLHSASDFAGTGMGLAMVERIIRKHGGRVWAEGAVGQGATFYFTLGEEATEASSVR